MIKLNILTVLACILFSVFTVSPAHAAPDFWVVVKGDIKNYYPKIIPAYTFAYQSSATSGVQVGVADRTDNNLSLLIKSAKTYSEKECKSQKKYAFDNFEIKHVPFGDMHNVLSSLSLNVICFD